MGITIGTFKQYAKSLLGLEPTVENLRSLTQQQAGVIYREVFWNKMQGDFINSQPLANLIFDGFVNMGRNGIKLLQREIGVVADGELGPNTLAVLNQSAPSVVFEGLKDARVKFYNSLVVRKPELKVFLNGWLNRVKSFKYEI
jgi:lysozyme family protein